MVEQLARIVRVHKAEDAKVVADEARERGALRLQRCFRGHSARNLVRATRERSAAEKKAWTLSKEATNDEMAGLVIVEGQTKKAEAAARAKATVRPLLLDRSRMPDRSRRSTPSVAGDVATEADARGDSRARPAALLSAV